MRPAERHGLTPVATHARALRRNGRDPTPQPPLQAVGKGRAAVDVEAQT